MLKRKIVFFTKYSDKGPSSRYRSYQYFSFFQEEFTIICHPLFNDQYVTSYFNNQRRDYIALIKAYISRIYFLLKYLRSKELLFIEYELLPYFPPIFEFLLHRFKTKVILDFDDAIFHNYDLHPSIFVRKLFSKKIGYITSMADIIITGSPYLTAYLQKFNNNIFEIPTSVLLKKYFDFSGVTSNSNIYIGWLGSRSTSSNILMLRDVITSMETEAPGVFFKFMGVDPDIAEKFKSKNVIFEQWSERNELSFLASLDLGIMPLHDTPFNRGKCGFKLIQYMAMGKPTISTPLAANIKISRGEKNMFATTEQEWLKCFVNFISNREFFRSVGSRNRAIISSFYSVESNAMIYINLFKNISNVRN